MPKKESFKQSMDRLDEIIARLNQNEVELEEAITLFEEGLKLVKQCDARLKQFEQRVSVLKMCIRDSSRRHRNASASSWRPSAMGPLRMAA